jgi:hypothetical protein
LAKASEASCFAPAAVTILRIEWRGDQNKTANAYVIEISLKFKEHLQSPDRRHDSGHDSEGEWPRGRHAASVVSGGDQSWDRKAAYQYGR